MRPRATHATKEAASPDRERFVLVLEPLVGVNAIRALRQLLKFALRACGLKCVAIRADTTSALGSSDVTREQEKYPAPRLEGA